MLDKTSVFLIFLIPSVLAACPEGTTYNNQFNKCYKFVSEATSFILAEKNCLSMGGSLVSISNIYENTFVTDMAGSQQADQFWVGLNFLAASQWTWISGDTYTYRNWASLQPQSQNCLSCGAVNVPDNLWRSVQCYTALPYMCQIDPNASPVSTCSTPTTTAATTATPTAPPIPEPTPCPTGHCPDSTYVLNPATCKCYKLSWGSEFTYNQSVAWCAGYSATLPIILNDVDDSFVSNLLRTTFFGYSPWLELYCAGNTTSSCTWKDGSPLGYSNFAPGFPVEKQYVYKWYLDGLWYTRTQANPYIENCACQRSEESF